jgi:hypothetical protein
VVEIQCSFYRICIFTNVATGHIIQPGGPRVGDTWSVFCSHGNLCFGEYTYIFSISSPSIVRVIKWRKMRWAGHRVHMGERRGIYRVLVGKPEGE